MSKKIGLKQTLIQYNPGADRRVHSLGRTPGLVVIQGVPGHPCNHKGFCVTLFLLYRMITETKKMKIGDPLDRSTQHGPQNHLAHLKKLEEYCETGIKEVSNILLAKSSHE